jgi:hypothetical protein
LPDPAPLFNPKLPRAAIVEKLRIRVDKSAFRAERAPYRCLRLKASPVMPLENRIDNWYLRDYFDRCPGCTHVKRLHLILVLFLLGAAVCVFAVPRQDLPETTFNEADTPVNLAPPVLPRIQIVRPTVDSIAVLPALPNHSTGRVANNFVLEPATSPRHRDSHSLQALLCTFLI